MNTITHVLDGSAVYGSSAEEQRRLRSFSGGKMRTQTVKGRVLPPPDFNDCTASQRSEQKCPFLGGDTRINTTRKL